MGVVKLQISPRKTLQVRCLAMDASQIRTLTLELQAKDVKKQQKAVAMAVAESDGVRVRENGAVWIEKWLLVIFEI